MLGQQSCHRASASSSRYSLTLLARQRCHHGIPCLNQACQEHVCCLWWSPQDVDAMSLTNAKNTHLSQAGVLGFCPKSHLPTASSNEEECRHCPGAKGKQQPPQDLKHVVGACHVIECKPARYDIPLSPGRAQVGQQLMAPYHGMHRSDTTSKPA